MTIIQVCTYVHMYVYVYWLARLASKKQEVVGEVYVDIASIAREVGGRSKKVVITYYTYTYIAIYIYIAIAYSIAM